MNAAGLRQLFQDYGAYMRNERLAEVRPLYEEQMSATWGPSLNEQLQEDHIAWMCTEAQKFINVGEFDKANRWLGFIQGYLWAHGCFSINDLRDQVKIASGEMRP